MITVHLKGFRRPCDINNHTAIAIMVLALQPTYIAVLSFILVCIDIYRHI